MTDWTDPADIGRGGSSLDMWNTYLRDNMTHIKNPPTDVDNFTYTGSDFVTASPTSWAAISGFSVTIATYGGDILVSFSASLDIVTAAAIAYFDIAIDGQRQGGNDGILAFNDNTMLLPVTLTWVIQNVVQGSHTIVPYWKVSSGDLILKAGQIPQFYAREFS